MSTPVHAKDSRSVSSTLHDRTKASSTTNLPNQTSRSSARAHHVNSQRRASSQSRGSNSGSNSSSTARETFMNYFFGQPGPSPNSAPPGGQSPAVHAMSGSTHPTGRELMQSPAPTTGLMAGKQPDKDSAAFDMKSLGKHIEAVSRFTS